METFNAIVVEEEEIVLSNSEDLAKVYKLLDDDENFILSWDDNGKNVAQVIVATNLSARVKNNETLLKAEEIRSVI